MSEEGGEGNMSKRKVKGLSDLAKRFLAVLVSITMVLGMLPMTTMAADSASDTRIVDDSTIHDWKNLFVEENTYDAGAVWTDKSVFTEVPNDFKNVDKLAMKDADNNFLVALSALASNKEIVGYSTIPTDTILILDLSQSMDNSGSIPQTISSANAAIQRLLDLNKNNRVGIVLYSGNASFGVSQTSTGKVLLGLNRYTPSTAGNYLTYTGNNNTSVNIASGLRIEGSNSIISTRNTAKTTEGGTYIQNGLDLAMDEFLKANPTIEEDNVQGGTTRMPIFVLMSDGAPTSGTPSYTNIGSSTVGNGGATSNGLGFMTQLTAAYALSEVENHYNKNADEEVDAKFYTLGLNLSQGDQDGQYVANSVLNPETSVSGINTYWDNLFRNGSVRFQSPGTSNSGNNQNIWVTVTRDTDDGLTRDSQYYVDEYFDAGSNAELNAAFAAIVNEIILQSAYYPTLVDGGDHDLDGYITFEDELGHFMEVKHITGLMLGDSYLYTGEALLKMMASDEFGDRYTYTELGWELVETVAERIGVSQDVAIELLQNAWADGQLSYTSDTEYSNYIGWYEGANGEYVAYWNESHTAEDVPKGATYITRSYGFYGKELETEADIVGSDMMHIVVKVRKEIATGHEDVVFQIPASLIPVITYHVELDADNFDDAKNVKMKREDHSPIRLLFEVGLRSDINELNVAEIMANESHKHYNAATGEYYFYTNQWGSGDGNQDVNYDEPLTHLVTISHFHPAVENERYYYTDDIVIFSDQNGTVYNGSTNPSQTGATYYHAQRVFERTGNGDAAVMKMHYEPIAAETLRDHAKRANDGSWYIEEETIYQLIDGGYYLEKNVNRTGTIKYVDYPVILGFGQGQSVDTYDIYDFLGNNGRMSLTPATGIKLTKMVDETITDANATFDFRVELDGVGNASYTFVNASGTEGTINFTNGISDVITLKADDTIYITDIPAGTKYKVYEVEDDLNYIVDSVTIDGTVQEKDEAEGTITAHKLENIGFTNTTRDEGDLIISKTVTHNLGSNYEIPANKTFTVHVELKDGKDVVFANGTEVETSFGTKKVEDGVLKFELAHDQSVTIQNLLEGTKYTVTEQNIPNGFTLQTDLEDRTGEIIVGTKEVDLVNAYAPSGAPTVQLPINITKKVKIDNVEATDWNSRTFAFELEILQNDEWVDVLKDNAKVTGSATQTAPNFTLNIPEEYLTSVGTYYFRILEDVSTAGNIVSDTARYFRVVVTDTNMDGALEIADVIVNGGSVGTTNVPIEFINQYVNNADTIVNIPVKKILNNNTNVEIPFSEFSFRLTNQDNASETEVINTNAHGDAIFHKAYATGDYSELANLNGTVTFKYTLEEVKGNRPSANSKGMAYSSEEYEVVVTLTRTDATIVSQNVVITKTGASISEADGVAKFTNTFTLGAVPFEVIGTKNLVDIDNRPLAIGNGQFTFNMYQTGSDFSISAGTTAIQARNIGNSFTLQDTITTAGVYYYVIEEANESVLGMQYDSTRYHATVVVGAASNGLDLEIKSQTIVKVGSAGNTSVEFNNKYVPTPTSIVLSGTKVLEGKILEREQFEFALYENNIEIATTKNAANGVFSFGEISYDREGEHTYTIKEIGKGLNWVNYDDSTFEVKVLVTDVGGRLEANVVSTVETDGADAEGVDAEVIFRNVFNPIPATIQLRGVKLLDNRELEDGEFTFNVFSADENFVYDKTSTPVATATNNASGAITFDSFKLSKPDTYYFVVAEDTSAAREDIVYDNAEYQITVTVFDMGYNSQEGKYQLGSRVSYAMNGEAVDSAVFSNVYFPPVIKQVYEKGKLDINIDGKAVSVGEVLTYEITYTNLSKTNSADAVITDTIPKGTTYVEGSANNNGIYDAGKGTITWTLDDVAADTNVELRFDVTVTGKEAEVANTASAVIGNNQYSSNTVYNYTFEKEVDKTEAKIGEELTYEVEYANYTGAEADIIITDKLDEGLTYVEGSATDGGVYDKDTHTITWTLEAVKKGIAGKVSFKAKTNEKAIKVIDNIATVQVADDPEVKTTTAETKIIEEVPVKVETPKAPVTGDNNSVAMWSTLTFASLMMCGAILVIGKKKQDEI